MTRLVYAIILAVSFGAQAAWAQSSVPQLIGKYRDWTAYKVTERGAFECYMVTEPTDSKPEGVNRGDILAFISHRPAQKVEGEFNIQIGYPFKQNSLGSLKIGGSKFNLLTVNQDAWLDDPKDEPRALKAMRQGNASETAMPLLTLERLTFRFVAAGFALLSATLLAGWYFSETLNHRWVWDHKTTFSVLSWLTMGVLLWGRWQLGWRGRVAVRMLYLAAGLLLLGYVGSRFVLEVLLQRG